MSVMNRCPDSSVGPLVRLATSIEGTPKVCVHVGLAARQIRVVRVGGIGAHEQLDLARPIDDDHAHVVAVCLAGGDRGIGHGQRELG